MTVGLAARIDAELLGFLSGEGERLPPEARPLLDELEAIVRAGGKRLRPRFCYWGHRAGGGAEAQPILRAAAALELLHTFAMIFDDVMDDSAVRRDRSTTFHVLAALGSQRGDARRFGTSAAILTGTLGFVLADRLLTGSGFGPAVLSDALDRYDDMRIRAIAGQYLDLLATHRGDADEATVRRIASLKSGSYSVVDPLLIGAKLAGATPEVLEALQAYGQPLGEAFQHADDVLGVFGDPAVTGKDAFGDLREGKQTILLAKARELAGAEDRKLLDARVGADDLDEADVDRIRSILSDCGALEATERLIAELADEASSALDPDLLGEEATTELASLVEAATVRRS